MLKLKEYESPINQPILIPDVDWLRNNIGTMCSNNTGMLNSILLILFVNSSLPVDLHQESLRGEKESYYYLN